MASRGKTVALIVGCSALTLAGALAYLGHPWLIESWYILRLRSDDEATWTDAAGRLGEMRSLKAVPHLLRKIDEVNAEGFSLYSCGATRVSISFTACGGAVGGPEDLSSISFTASGSSISFTASGGAVGGPEDFTSRRGAGVELTPAAYALFQIGPRAAASFPLKPDGRVGEVLEAIRSAWRDGGVATRVPLRSDIPFTTTFLPPGGPCR